MACAASLAQAGAEVFLVARHLDEISKVAEAISLGVVRLMHLFWMSLAPKM